MKDDQMPHVREPIINCDTAMGTALMAMFATLESELLFESAQAGAVTVIVFGGCAVHLYTSHRVSSDVDAEIFEAAVPDGFDLRALLAQMPETFIDEKSGRTLELNYDLQFTVGLGPIHEDYVERGVPLGGLRADSPLRVLIASPVDVAISKLGRATDQDIGDIHALLRSGFILASDFERLALQAIDCYVGNHEPPTTILTNILQDYLEIADGAAL